MSTSMEVGQEQSIITDWATTEFPLPPGYDKLLRRYFELTIDEDWVLSADGNNNDTFFREYRIWKQYMRQVHLGPFMELDEYYVIRNTMNASVARWMAAGWVTRYDPDTYSNHTISAAQVSAVQAASMEQATESALLRAAQAEAYADTVATASTASDRGNRDDDGNDSNGDGNDENRLTDVQAHQWMEEFVRLGGIDPDIYYPPMDIVSESPLVEEMEMGRNDPVALPPTLLTTNVENVFENEYYDEYYDEYDNETDGGETDDDLPALLDTITGQYVTSTPPPLPAEPGTESVLLSLPNEMMDDNCCICLERHERCYAVTLKNEQGNVCHEIGMTCFLQWSDRNRRQRTAVQCPLCKSKVSTIVYQYCLPLVIGT